MKPARRGRARLATLAALGAALLLQACGHVPAVAGAPVSAAWWRAFGDPVLDRLVDQALAHNTDLRAAAAHVAEARALGEAQHAAALPTVDFGASGQRSRSISAATGKPYLSTVGQPQFQAAWEIDLWGRIDALGQAADAQLRASEATRDSAALSVAATTAAGYIQLRALDARLEVARQTLAARDEALRLARSREQRGYSSALETRQSEAEYRATAQAVPQLALAVRRQEHALNLLTGAAPGPVPRGRTLAELALPTLPDTGLPSELLRRRPDLAAAESQLAASDAQLAAARAQMLPAIRLNASLGRISSSALSGDPFTLWGVGGSVLAPLFDGGRLRAQARAADARRDQALAGYEKAVLTAFGEVEDQLAALDEYAKQAEEVQAQAAALEEAVRIATNRHREGYASYLDELDAQRNLFSARQSAVQLRADRLAAQVALYRALGGGWSPAALAAGPGPATAR